MPSAATARGARGGGVTVVGSAASLTLQLASVLALSRLLTPDDFGIVAMVLVFVALGELVRDFGIPTVALQIPNLSSQQASNLFWANAGMATGVATLLASSAPLLVDVYHEPRLSGVVPTLAVTLLLNGLAGQIRVQLARRARFHILVICDLSSKFLALILAIGLAVSGFGYWALVAQSLFASGCLLLSLWVASRWLPSLPRRGHGMRRMALAGLQYWFSYLLAYLQDNAATFAIGRLLGAPPLGVYNRGSQLITSPMGAILTPLTQVAIPTLRSATQEGFGFPRLISRIQVALTTAGVLVMAAAASTADSLVPLLLGAGWSDVVPVFRLLTLAACFQVLSHVSFWIFVHKGMSRSLLRYNLVAKPVAIVCVLVGASAGGLVGAAAGYAVGRAVGWPLNLAWLSSEDDVPARSLAITGALIVAAGSMACGVTMTLLELWPVTGVKAVIIGSMLSGILTLGMLSLNARIRSELGHSTRSLVGAFWARRNSGPARA